MRDSKHSHGTEKPVGAAPADSKPSWRRQATTVLIGFAGAAVIWWASPYNNYVLANSNISDSYLPVIVLFLILVLVLGINPLLRWLAPRLELTRRQLATVVGIMLVACVLPGQGLHRMLPYMIAHVPLVASADKNVADRYERLGLPSWLFPEKVAYGEPTPVCEKFRGQLPPGESIPWAAWLRPLIAWGSLLLFAWLMMLGLGMIVLPQWRDNERLAFPLVTVQRALIEPAPPGKLLAPLLSSRSFWIAAAAVFLLHLLNGLNIYFPDSVPAVPLKFGLAPLFTEQPWQHMHPFIHSAKVYFLFVGLTFFMPNRISFSIWFILLVYGVWRALGPAYGYQYPIEKMDAERLGAVIALGLFVLWIGRQHWARVFGRLFGRVRDEADRRDRWASWAFVIGAAGMVGWLLAVGVQLRWALMLVGFAFLVALVVARFVAETGLPFFRIYDSPMALMKLAPTKAVSPISVYMCVVVDILFAWGARVGPTAAGVQAMALHDDGAARRAPSLGRLFLVVLLVGLLVAGAVHLRAGYRNDATLNHSEVVYNAWGRGLLGEAIQAAGEVEKGQLSRQPFNHLGHMTAGAGVAGLLYSACLAWPRWPFHPMGILMIDSYYGHEAWGSVFLGWLIKAVLVAWGGARLYRVARPFFLGVIVGEVLAAMFWAAVPVVLVGLNLRYQVVQVLPL